MAETSRVGDAAITCEGPCYPATPVDCLISELRDMFIPVLSRTSVLTLADFEKRVEQFKREVAFGEGVFL